jgi:hypothetical protein
VGRALHGPPARTFVPPISHAEYVEAVRGAEDFYAALRKMEASIDEWDIAAHKTGMDRLWFSLQSLLSAAANVSKALWGSSDQG